MEFINLIPAIKGLLIPFVKTITTMRLPLLLTTITWMQSNFAQNTSDSLPKVATVNVTITDMKAKPRKAEQVLFRGEKTGKILIGVSDATGKIKLQLPPGDSYHVSVKSITDTENYTIINVPALEADEYFTEPFWVNIQFEPARRYRLDNVHFDTDKATLRSDSYPQLKELLEYLERHDEVKIEIAGHTDNVGSDVHNLKLSQDRANTIRSYLISKGIKAARLIAKGYGAAEPVSDNITDKGRQMNRRTEVRFL